VNSIFARPIRGVAGTLRNAPISQFQEGKRSPRFLATMRRRAWLALLCATTGVCAAQYTVFTAAEPFQAAAGPLLTEGFNTSHPATNQVDFGPFSAATESANVFWANAATFPAVVSEGAGSIYGFDASQPSSIGNGMAFNFDQPIRSFGIDIVDLSSGISVVVPGLMPTVTLANAGQTMSPRFFGLVSEIPFSSVRFHWGTAGDAVGFDDLRYSAPIEVPTLVIVSAGPGLAMITWTPETGTNWVLQETLSLSSANWTNSPSGATNPIAVPATLPKWYRLFKP
jgi:hypothetical protein